MNILEVESYYYPKRLDNNIQTFTHIKSKNLIEDSMDPTQ
jgi:hypothetical protein